MIDNKLQLYIWFISIIVGFIYASFLNLFIKSNKGKKLPLIIIQSIIFIIICVLLLMRIYYICNNGHIHYSYLIFWIIGYHLFLLVKFNVKRHKN